MAAPIQSCFSQRLVRSFRVLNCLQSRTQVGYRERLVAQSSSLPVVSGVQSALQHSGWRQDEAQHLKDAWCDARLSVRSSSIVETPEDRYLHRHLTIELHWRLKSYSWQA